MRIFPFSGHRHRHSPRSPHEPERPDSRLYDTVLPFIACVPFGVLFGAEVSRIQGAAQAARTLDAMLLIGGVLMLIAVVVRRILSTKKEGRT